MADRPRVLVVDDDAFLRITVSIELPEVDLLEATRLAEAWDIALEETPDAVLLDRWLPDGDGLDFVRLLRRTAGLAETPVLLVTAGFDEADRAAVDAAGVDEYLAKPIEPTRLADALHAALARSAELQAAAAQAGADGDDGRRRGLFRRQRG